MVKKSNNGFTLIELLVVISIIGLLSSVVLASLNSARVKARDVKRKQEIQGIITALSIYYNTHGYYPQISYGGNCGTALNGGSGDTVSPALIGDGLYGALPVAPANSGTCGGAYYAGTCAGWSCPVSGQAQNIAVLTQLEQPDANCTPWGNWYQTGSYCNGYYIKVLP